MSVKSHFSSNNTLASARKVTCNELNLTPKSFNSKKASGAENTKKTCKVGIECSIKAISNSYQ